MAAKKPQPQSKKAKRAKQLDIPGTERKVHKDITDAASEFLDARDDWEDAGKTMASRKAALDSVMRKHGLKSYRDDGAKLDVQLLEGEAKVKRLDDG